MFPADFLKAVRGGPFPVCRSQDRLVGKRTCSAFPQGGKSLIEAVVIEKAEYEKGAGKLSAFIGTVHPLHAFYAGKGAQRLVIVFR